MHYGAFTIYTKLKATVFRKNGKRGFYVNKRLMFKVIEVRTLVSPYRRDEKEPGI